MPHIKAYVKILCSEPITTDPMEFHYMFYGVPCHTSTAEDWTALSFKVAFSVDLMPFKSDYKEPLNHTSQVLQKFSITICLYGLCTVDT
jgi:hypothetical protein